MDLVISTKLVPAVAKRECCVYTKNVHRPRCRVSICASIWSVPINVAPCNEKESVTVLLENTGFLWKTAHQIMEYYERPAEHVLRAVEMNDVPNLRLRLRRHNKNMN